MTKEEMKKMEGTEFIYRFHDDEIEAYVKKVDPEAGMYSCWSFGFTTKKGARFEPLNEDEVKEGACCLMTLDPEESLKDRIKSMDTDLSEIASTGAFNATTKGGSSAFIGCQF
jgi:hypothetical protein